MIYGIWAEDKQGLIGNQGKLPWHIPSELQHFKRTTMGQAILMGRKTFEGMNKRVLPGRTNLILTHDQDYASDNPAVLILHSKEEVLNWYKNQDKDLFVTGGSSILALFEPDMEILYRTIVQEKFTGDAYFPAHFDFQQFKEIANVHQAQDDKTPYAYDIKKYQRI